MHIASISIVQKRFGVVYQISGTKHAAQFCTFFTIIQLHNIPNLILRHIGSISIANKKNLSSVSNLWEKKAAHFCTFSIMKHLKNTPS